jgi:hypothetical protein
VRSIFATESERFSARELQPPSVEQSNATDGPAAYVQLSTDWANAAMQYMSKGYYDEAKDLVEAGKIRSDDRPSVFRRMVSHIGSRFDDPSAALVPRYLALRLGEDGLLNTLGDSHHVRVRRTWRS